jgi:hypothetical protein
MIDLFLSYTSADREWVERFASKLEAEQIGGRPISVFFDQWDIDHGENILDRIETGLKESRFLAVVLSPAFNRAEWPRLEWQSRVHEDPAGMRGRILPVLLHKFDPVTREQVEFPLPLRLLRYFDFTESRRFDSEFQQLLRRLRGERPTRGSGISGSNSGNHSFVGQEEPTGGPESLVSNLLPVIQYPTAIWSDFTKAEKKQDVWKAWPGAKVAPFLLHGGRLFAFTAPSEPKNPFVKFWGGTNLRQERPIDWIKDSIRAPLLVGLFNQALSEHCYQLRIRRAKLEKSQYFCPTFDGKSRAFRWGEGARVRTLAKMAENAKGEPFGVHHSAQMRFIILDDEIYLLIEPGWLFTDDGIRPMTGRQVGVLSTKWGGRERNAAVLRNLLMWGQLLAGRNTSIEISLGGTEFLRMESVPAHAEINVGIASDSIPLERILGGTGGGEVADLGHGDVDELDVIAALKGTGALDEDEGIPTNDGPEMEFSL